jgi:hypothetical protein
LLPCVVGVGDGYFELFGDGPEVLFGERQVAFGVEGGVLCRSEVDAGVGEFELQACGKRIAGGDHVQLRRVDALKVGELGALFGVQRDEFGHLCFQFTAAVGGGLCGCGGVVVVGDELQVRRCGRVDDVSGGCAHQAPRFQHSRHAAAGVPGVKVRGMRRGPAVACPSLTSSPHNVAGYQPCSACTSAWSWALNRRHTTPNSTRCISGVGFGFATFSSR